MEGITDIYQMVLQTNTILNRWTVCEHYKQSTSKNYKKSEMEQNSVSLFCSVNLIELAQAVEIFGAQVDSGLNFLQVCFIQFS